VSWTLKTVDPNVPVQLIHASRGKRTRAEPVAALYEQGRVHHVGGLPELEDQLCLWDARSDDISPDRLDALVWAVTELAVTYPPVELIDTSRPPGPRREPGLMDALRFLAAPTSGIQVRREPAPWNLVPPDPESSS